MEQRVCIEFCVKNKIKCSEIFEMLKVAYGESALSKKNVYKWYNLLQNGKEDAEYESCPESPSTSTTEEKVNVSNIATTTEGSNSNSHESNNYEPKYEIEHDQKEYKCDICKHEYFTASFFELHFKEGLCTTGKVLEIKKENVEEELDIKQEIITETSDFNEDTALGMTEQNEVETLYIKKEIISPYDDATDDYVVKDPLDIKEENISPDEDEELYEKRFKGWTVYATKLLIDLYKEHRNNVGTTTIRKMKSLWELISKDMIKNGCNFTTANCENRWKVLQRNFKKYMTDRNAPDREIFEYYDDMEQIFQSERMVFPHTSLTSENEMHINQSIVTENINANGTNMLQQETHVVDSLNKVTRNQINRKRKYVKLPEAEENKNQEIQNEKIEYKTKRKYYAKKTQREETFIN